VATIRELFTENSSYGENNARFILDVLEKLREAMPVS
jgi:hypothetical protein